MPLVKPTIQLTKSQWKAMLERVLEKGGSAAGQVFNQTPPVTRQMGRLLQSFGPQGESPPLGEVKRIRGIELPLEEARAQFFQNPQQYKIPQTPEVDVLRKVTPGSAEELASGMAYEKRKYGNILPQGVEDAAQYFRKLADDELINRSMAARGVGVEDIRPGVTPKSFVESQGAEIASTPIESVAQKALAADALWKHIGGGRSIQGKMWDRFLEEAPQGDRMVSQSGREYFLNCFSKWHDNPQQFSKSKPREARVLDAIWSELTEGM